MPATEDTVAWPMRRSDRPPPPECSGFAAEKEELPGASLAEDGSADVPLAGERLSCACAPECSR